MGNKNSKIKYGIRINNTDDKKLKKQLTMSSQTRMKIFLDEYRVWNMGSDLKMRKSLWLVMNLRDMSTAQKNGYLGNRLDITIKEKQMNLNRTFFTQLLTDIILLYTMLAIK